MEAIPFEILVMIFKNLKGTDAAACRAVCRRWKDVVDSLTDDAWKDFCHRDFLNTNTAKHVCNLGYRDLYKSLTLWSKVEEAEEKCPTKPLNNVNWVKVLNNTVAVLRSFHNIEYYDIKTMILVSRKTYNFPMWSFDENEYLIALFNSDNGNIHVIIKSNDREFVVGEPDPFFDEIEEGMFMLLDTELYFRREEDMWAARLKVVDGKETIETVGLNGLGDDVVAFARAGHDGVNILTYAGNIYTYYFGATEFTWRVKCKDDNVIIALRRFGFLWSERNIYEWLSDTFPKDIHSKRRITELIPTVIHTHNHVVLLGTNAGSIHVYKRPYNENGEIKIYKSKPDRLIDLNKYREVNHSIGNINQVDVIETLFGHRLLVQASLRTGCSHWLFCIDLLHKQLNVTNSAIEGDIMRIAARRSLEEAPMPPTKKPRL